MEVLKEILKNYWQIILAAFCMILSVILQACKKKPINSIITDIFYIVPKFINQVECPGNGASKKEAVINLTVDYLKGLYPELHIDVSTLNLISAIIEKYLDTPKKGGNENG